MYPIQIQTNRTDAHPMDSRAFEYVRMCSERPLANQGRTRSPRPKPNHESSAKRENAGLRFGLMGSAGGPGGSSSRQKFSPPFRRPLTNKRPRPSIAPSVSDHGLQLHWPPPRPVDFRRMPAKRKVLPEGKFRFLAYCMEAYQTYRPLGAEGQSR